MKMQREDLSTLSKACFGGANSLIEKAKVVNGVKKLDSFRLKLLSAILGNNREQANLILVSMMSYYSCSLKIYSCSLGMEDDDFFEVMLFFVNGLNKINCTAEK